MKVKLSENLNFIIIAVFSVVVTLLLAYYAFILLYGKNSYNVYVNLLDKKQNLQIDIKNLQQENALLQKKYLELKNLEPEEI